MSLQFETVKYQTGYTTTDTAGGYIDLHYDLNTSPNGETPSYQTNSTQVTDLANNNLQTSGGQVVPQPSSTALAASLAFSSITSSILTTSTGAGVNAGGFALPALGTLTSGLSSSNMIQQQLQAATVSLAGRAASTIAGGVIGGITSGLGASGTQVLGLAVQAITNPSAALHTAENMAINYVTNAASNALQNALNPIATKIQNQISGFIGENITAPITTALGDASSAISQGAIDLYSNFTSEYDLGGAINGIDIEI